jgi:hypothetical protein
VLALLCLGLVTADLPPVSSLETLVRVAAVDSHNQRPEDRQFTRYASLHGVDETVRADFLKAWDLAKNKAHFQGGLIKSRLIAGGRLIRLNTRELGWDKYTRQADIDKLATLGVKFRDDGKPLNRSFVDIWEGLSYAEPFFDLDLLNVDPALVKRFRDESRSYKPILSAHWIYPRLMLEQQDGGVYSFLLLLPDTEAQLYKRLGADQTFADTIDTAKHGAVVVKSASVAYNPREIQLIQTQTGYDTFGLWRTLDFAKVDRKEKDVRQSPGGKAVHDGREILFPLPNGLLGSYLANGPAAGQKQVNIVPQAIAEDQRLHNEDVVYSQTKSVVNSFKCWDCHGESRGIIGFGDNVIKLIVPDRLDTGYTVRTAGPHDAKEAEAEARRIELFFRDGLVKKAALHRDSYDARVKECTGLGTFEATRLLVRFFEKYTPVYASELVTPLQAAKEMGYPLPVARVLWLAASDPRLYDPPNDQMGILAGGEPITRIMWELNVKAAFKVAAQPLRKN